MKAFCKTVVASLNSKERLYILSSFLIHFNPVFLYILQCFSSRLKGENVSLEFEDSLQDKLFQSVKDWKTSLLKFGTMFCKVSAFSFPSIHTRRDPLEYSYFI